MDKLTPGGNVLWASSRFMIPQHVEASLEQERKARKKTKQLIDDEVIEEIDRKLRESLQQNKIVTLTVFDDYEDKTYAGVVRKLDTETRRVKLEVSDGFVWIPFYDIVAAE